jgi:hypothetical protein
MEMSTRYLLPPVMKLVLQWSLRQTLKTMVQSSYNVDK